MNDPTILNASISSRPDKQGVDLELENMTSGEIEVSLPDPYTCIDLFDLDGQPLDCKPSIAVWEKGEQIVPLAPEERLVVSIDLSYPIWIGIKQEVLVDCTIVCRIREEQVVEHVRGQVILDLPSLEEIVQKAKMQRKERKSAMQSASNNVEAQKYNFSRFVTFQKLAPPSPNATTSGRKVATRRE